MKDDAEFVPEWDVRRDNNGKAVTITQAQMEAIWHALYTVERVRASEGYRSIWSNGSAEPYKSRLLGRMLLDGLPPTRTKPPLAWGGPAWALLPGGDPFVASGETE